MAILEHTGVRLHYEVEGRHGAPWLVLSNALGSTAAIWEPQIGALLQHFRVLRYDTRGHGQSGAPEGPYSVAQLGEDVIALMDHLDIASARYCGQSLGGMTGMWLGIHHSHRFERLALCNTAAKIGTPQAWASRIDQVTEQGMAAVIPGALERWFTAEYRGAAPQQLAKIAAMLAQASPHGYAGCCAALRDADLRAQLHRITVPTLFVAGAHDATTTPAATREMVTQVGGAVQYAEMDCAHVANWECADTFTRILIDFLRL